LCQAPWGVQKKLGAVSRGERNGSRGTLSYLGERKRKRGSVIVKIHSGVVSYNYQKKNSRRRNVRGGTHVSLSKEGS